MFPSTASTRTWLTDAGRSAAAAARRPRRPAPSTVCRCSTPPTSTTERQLSDKISDHKRQLEQRRIDEERRLLYVALTRAEDTLLLSGHHWGATGVQAARPVGVPAASSRTSSTRRPPRATLRSGRAVGARRLPTVSRTRCATTSSRRSGRSTRWRRAAATSTAARRWCAAAHGGRRRRDAAADVDGWAADVDALLAERDRRAGATGPRRCPRSCRSAPWWNSAAIPTRCARRLQPPAAGPPRPACVAGHRVPRLGAAVLRRRAAVRSRRPARRGRRRPPATTRRAGRAAGRVPASPWAARTPDRRRGAVRHGHRRHAWCAAASTRCSPTPTAASPWSTGRPATRRRRRRPSGTPPSSSRSTGWRGRRCAAARESSVRAAFHYVRSGADRQRPTTLPDADELAALLAEVAA